MFWLLAKWIVSPQTLQTHIILNWRNQDFIPAFTQWTVENKKPFKASNSPQAHTSALNPPTVQKKNNNRALCAHAFSVNCLKRRKHKKL